MLKENSKKVRSSKALFWILVLYNIIILTTTLMYYNITLLFPPETQETVLKCVSLGTFLFFPILRYLGEHFNRYKIMMSGVIMTILSCLFYIILLIVEAVVRDNRGKNIFTNNLRIVLIVPAICGGGLYVTEVLMTVLQLTILIAVFLCGGCSPVHLCLGARHIIV